MNIVIYIIIYIYKYYTKYYKKYFNKYKYKLIIYKYINIDYKLIYKL